jgi:branched-chain amino acid transport system substrate-binding protein
VIRQEVDGTMGIEVTTGGEVISMRSYVRNLLMGFVIAAVALAFAGTTTGAGQAGATLKIGIPLALTGPIAEQAEEMVRGYKLYLKQHDNKLGGVPVQLIIEDTQADPSKVIAKTRKLISSDHVDFIGGAALALESLAVIQVTAPRHAAFITPMSSADDLTQRKLAPTFARLNMTSSQPNLYFGEWVYKNLHYKRIAIIAQDYAYGWESAGGFQYAFEKSGGKIVQKIFVPFTASDYAPLVRQLNTSVDAVYAILVGAHVPRFEKAYNQFGLGGKVPLIGGPDIADEDALHAAGQDAVGITIVHEYSKDTPAEATQTFIKDWQSAYGGQTPSYWGESTYTAAHWIDEAITNYRKKTGMSANAVPGWIAKHPEQFIDAIVATKLAVTPRGPLSMDAHHNPINNLYIFKVDKPNHKTVLGTIENASQFWTETPKQFLSHPVFSRDFPPCCQ